MFICLLSFHTEPWWALKYTYDYVSAPWLGNQTTPRTMCLLPGWAIKQLPMTMCLLPGWVIKQPLWLCVCSLAGQSNNPYDYVSAPWLGNETTPYDYVSAPWLGNETTPYDYVSAPWLGNQTTPMTMCLLPGWVFKQPLWLCVCSLAG